ncbi:helical membrane plugin domain-containing protein [Paraburkholderia caballeronis]|uniref:DUF1641 domain-containing protein n=1 Tax=Paraburkholderia caballeronis TaxID=416943 RepID=A0A1H7MUH8_9BURK|nr:hypothetical protein [Paraburkholderia caballeronis]PXW26418.1 hypothetical protein C7403_104292 [Paraburkholderia caballeronis]PXX01965.1 hypothetical protein C7407_104292 [Paraburkholderia caballeronis]RAK01122.1 hypothetical protein C7409_104292 [Paraburkholderia caballeronis]SEB96792.1 hypothetical protein SAMN05445871_1403 [Paraburkholderia caballeronis]SEL14699.1 hypothetical protein SAMN05192542_105177 [Paraburkholderia caballeronis]
MAEPIEWKVKQAAPVEPDAHEALERLLQSLHEHGVLRFANDVVCSQTKIAEVLVDGLSREGALNAVQNIAALLIALSRIPPDRFYKLASAFAAAVDAMSGPHGREQPGEQHDAAAPGVRGVYRMLHDDDLWRALGPLAEAVKTFAERLDRDIPNPISDFSGKQGGT